MILVILVCAAIVGVVGLIFLLRAKRKAYRRMGAIFVTGAAAVYFLALASILWLAALWR